ncbi:MAG: 2-C-methyl-D-erythritol 2,4-cyclodiphosphate synthase [Candidatus Omnitrophica bacterium]|nr:2-C-methyl-D-erythritol 2,4-cyclodiphosphate synthase [Candidatus Omnitrophota bacterium]
MSQALRDKLSEYRSGIGYDIHRLVEGRKLVLGGVTIPFEKGLMGHSDADVLLHAIADAVLGAAGQGDIGELFPDTDKKYKGVSSLVLLKRVCEVAQSAGFRIANVDCVLLAEDPKITPYKDEMRKNIAGALDVSQGQVNVKATTNEGLGFVGRQEGLAAYASVLLRSREH